MGRLVRVGGAPRPDVRETRRRAAKLESYWTFTARALLAGLPLGSSPLA